MFTTAFAAALAAVLFAFPAAGASFSAPGVIESASGSGIEAVKGGTPVFSDDVAPTVSGDAGGMKRSDEDGTISVSLTGEDPDDGGGVRIKRVAMVSVIDEIDLSEWNALAVNVLLSPSGEERFSSCLLTVSLYTESDILRFKGDLAQGNKAVVIDVTPLKNRSAVKRVTATVEWENTGKNPGKITFSRLCGIKTTAPLPDSRMSSLSLSAGEGIMKTSGGFVTVTPSEGAAVLLCRIDPIALPADKREDGTKPVRYAVLKLTASGGSVAADFTPSDDADTARAPSYQTRSVMPGTHVYLFRFVSDKVETVRFTFRNPDGSPITCESLEFYITGSHDPAIDSAGCTIECTINDRTLSVDGRLKKSTAVEYIGKTLGLFTAPAVGGETVKLAEARAGSAFSFSVPLSTLPKDGRENYFWVSVLGEDGDVPITEKHFLDTVKSSEGNASVSGLYGAEPAGVFEAGLKRAVIDVRLDDLAENGKKASSGVAVTGDSGTYYLDGEYVRMLDSEMEFYDASGIGVYLRFSVDDPAAWFSEKRKTKEKDDPRGLDLYLAVTSFFCGRYKNTVSIVIPDVRGVGDVWEDAERSALLARLTYGAASVYSDSFIVTVPVPASGSETDKETFAVFVSESLFQIGQIPWSLLSETEESNFDRLDVCILSSKANGIAAPSFSAILWIPEGLSAQETAETFSDLCEKSRGTGSRAVILSVMPFERSGFFDYSILRSGKDGDLSRSRGTLDFEEVAGTVTSNSVLWDFSGAYSTEGWAAGSGIGSFGTAFHSGRSGERVLRATLDAESSHGIILRTFDEPIDFSLFPLIGFDLSVASDDGAVVTFIFGTAGGDAEFVLDCPPGEEERRIVCDLGDFPGAEGIGYFSVLIRSEGEATADLFDIAAYSRTEKEGSVAIGGPRGEKTPPRPEIDRKILLIPVAAGIILIPLGIHCFRSDRDMSFARAARRRERGNQS